MWSPTHPALFACVDLAGRLDLWNLNNDTEVHTHTCTHCAEILDSEEVGAENPSFVFQVPTASVYVEGGAALNRVRWAHSGKEIATGDSEGQVQVYDVGEVRLMFKQTPLSQSRFSLTDLIRPCSPVANLRAQG